ncbi:homeobox protein CDX-1-like protein [Lates japonicus]|uniref:Homeobox protein CDX-1-like protein n=1 Tax=Lates japonicus TaxID=270547 RepID=A0AAD3QZJ6_LATJO|nr:homeobox protein CDX-1-like protein [Lates japonicus]
MGLWKTTLEANSKHTAQVTINCSIYQGDALSLLLFCIDLNTLSQIITKSGYRYRFQSGVSISHLLYMDDIKQYSRNKQETDSQIHNTRIYSNDIEMSVRLDKCSRMEVSKRGIMV